MKSLIPKTPRSLPERIISKCFRILRDIKRRNLRNRFIAISPCPPIGGDPPFYVHMLVCKRDFEMAICAAKSLVLSARKPICFAFHDDGSLSKHETDRLLSHFPGSKVISRIAADTIAEKELAAFPLIRKYRSLAIMMLKLIDVRLFSFGDAKAICMDSDILFFDYPAHLLDCVGQNGPINYFNKDIDSAYMLEPKMLSELCNAPLTPSINAGLSVVNIASIDFDKIERWLKMIDDRKMKIILHRIEQSLITMLSAQAPYNAAYLERGYDVVFDKPVETSVCKHYVGLIRHGFEIEGLSYLLKKKDFKKNWNSLVKNHLLK